MKIHSLLETQQLQTYTPLSVAKQQIMALDIVTFPELARALYQYLYIAWVWARGYQFIEKIHKKIEILWGEDAITNDDKPYEIVFAKYYGYTWSVEIPKGAPPSEVRMVRNIAKQSLDLCKHMNNADQAGVRFSFKSVSVPSVNKFSDVDRIMTMLYNYYRSDEYYWLLDQIQTLHHDHGWIPLSQFKPFSRSCLNKSWLVLPHMKACTLDWDEFYVGSVGVYDRNKYDAPRLIRAIRQKMIMDTIDGMVNTNYKYNT